MKLRTAIVVGVVAPGLVIVAASICIAVPSRKPPEASVPDSHPVVISSARHNSGSCKFVRWQTNPGFIQRHDLEAVCESGATFLGSFPASPRRPASQNLVNLRL